MTAFEDRTAATALRQIAKYGKTISIQRQGEKTYDETTLKYTEADTPAADVIKALVKDFDATTAARLGARVQSGDKIFTVAASGLTKPDLGASVTVDGETLAIVPKTDGGLEVMTVYAGEIAVLYRIHGRKS